jgi:hypothetical protein
MDKKSEHKEYSLLTVANLRKLAVNEKFITTEASLKFCLFNLG